MALPMSDDEWVPADTFGARLALIRQVTGWNYEQAGAACGIDPETWRGWEKKNRSPRRIHEIAQQIADASRCNYLWLVAGEAAVPRSRCFAPLVLVSGFAGQGELPFDSATPELALV